MPPKKESHAKISVDDVDDERTQLSKHITWVLRRGAAQSGIDIDGSGYVKIADLAKYKELKAVSEQKLLQVMEQSNTKKARYEISADKQYVRAYRKDERGLLNEALYGADASGASGAMGAYPPPYWPMGFPGMMPFMNPWAGYGWPQAAAAQTNRYSGIIKSFNVDKGFGFIECGDTYPMYQRDVFLHKAQIGNLSPGQGVTFILEVNKNGMPQANDVRPYGASGGKGGKGGKGKGKGKGEKGKSKGDGKGSKAKKEKEEGKDGEEGKEKEEGKEDSKGKEDASEKKPEAEAAKAPEAAA